MPDITKCIDHQCPKNRECYRYIAIPNDFRQSYFVESPRVKEGEKKGECNYYWPIKKENEDISR